MYRNVDSPLLLNGRTLTTTLIFPPPPGAIMTNPPCTRGQLFYLLLERCSLEEKKEER